MSGPAFIPMTFDELRAYANGLPVRCVHSRALTEEIVKRMERAAEFRGRFAEGYISALSEVLDLLTPEGS